MIYGLDELPAGAEIVRLTGDHMSGGVVNNHQRSRVLDCVLLAGVYYPIEHPGWIDTDAPMVPDAGALRFHGADTGFRPTDMATAQRRLAELYGKLSALNDAIDAAAHGSCRDDAIGRAEDWLLSNCDEMNALEVMVATAGVVED